MNGYIASLLGRTFGDAPLLAPRTPSVFEPPVEPEGEAIGIAGSSGSSEFRGVLGVGERTSREDSPRTAEEPRGTTGPRGTAVPNEPVTASLMHSLTEPGQVEVGEHVARPVAEPSSIEPVEPRIETRERVITERVVEPRPVTVTNVVREKERERVIEERTVTKEREPRLVLPEPPPVRRIAAPPSPSAHSVRVPAPALSPLHPGTRRGAVPPLRGANPSGVMPVHDAAPHAEEPVIRVTIGRVDVRAVVNTGAPRPARSEPQGPRLSLEDYLRMRDGGSR